LYNSYLKKINRRAFAVDKSYYVLLKLMRKKELTLLN